MPGGEPAVIHARAGHSTVMVHDLLMDKVLAPEIAALAETLLGPYRWVEDAAPAPAFEFRVRLVRDVGAGRMVDYETEGNIRHVLVDRSLMFDPLPEILTRQGMEALRNWA